MAHRTFVAFSSADPIVSDVIVAACQAAASEGHDFIPWNRNDVSQASTSLAAVVGGINL
jgi:hypothetical protein